MAQDNSQNDADAYYGNEEIEGGDIDLSFLDEESKEQFQNENRPCSPAYIYAGFYFTECHIFSCTPSHKFSE